MEAIIRHGKHLLIHCLNQYVNWVAEKVDGPVIQAIGIHPGELTEFFDGINALKGLLQSQDEPMSLSVGDHYLSYLKRAILHTLQKRSFDKERRSELTNDRALKERLEGDVKKISDLTKTDWFDQVVAFKTPKLTDFLTLQQAAENESISFAKREYDEKFHILNAPSLILCDIEYYRSVCALRGRPITVAFVDIDDLKRFNTNYGETKVDSDLLPKFMSELEAHVFSHGHAYRYGGDEYVVLLSNMSCAQACDLIAEFQRQLRKLDYYGIEVGPTVSVGVLEVSDDSVLTDKECLAMAEGAKGKAKDEDKGSIFINTGSRIGDDSYEKYQTG